MSSPVALLTLMALALPAFAAPAPKIDFQRQVRPILSNACFACHGPDKNTRLADLRLDTKEGAFTTRANGTPIIPGKPESSLIYQRITHANAGLRMPPAHTKKTLTTEQKETLRQWIAAGADWKEHWSFQLPVKQTPPPVANKVWGRNPIDNFILARLEAAGLKPNLDADKRTLIRRVSLDLTGLPPTPAEIDAFLKDTSKDAYEKVVDRLLASKQWGEHRGRYWLDAARYADTHGLHIDNYREMWPYRDWVINAFNRNLPFDRFTIEQLAGDMLPNRTIDQQIASGFNRCNITTNEGGSIPAEVDAMYQKDRVETTSTVFLGLTTGCANCHDHKFDPISQREMYQMVAFFKNTTQNPLDGNISDTPPIIIVPKEEDRDRYPDLQARAAELRKQKADYIKTAKPEIANAKQPIETASEVFALAAPPYDLPKGIEWTKGPQDGTQALVFRERTPLTVSSIPPSDPKQPFTFSSWVYVPNDGNTIIASNVDSNNQAGGWTIEVAARTPRFVYSLPGRLDKLVRRGTAAQRVRANEWVHIAVTYDGTEDAAGVTLYVNGKALSPDRPAPEIDEELRVADPSRIAFRLGGDGRRFTRANEIADIRLYNSVLNDDEVFVVARWNSDDESALQLASLLRNDQAYRTLAKQSYEAERELRIIRRRGAITHVMQEKDTRPTAHILFRGMYDQPRDEVSPDVPSALPPMSRELPRNRFGLAQWLVDAGNPLMSRVTVNRFWQEVFGTGIVRTSEDFGSQGEAPVNPELLDWLAIHFRESGWDVKAFYRMMVTSSTYRQSAAASDDKLKKDPENRMLSRGPRYRMDAEMVRDLALASSGLMTQQIGGPSVRPYQPEGIWETVAMKGSNTRFYKPDSGEKLYRRSMYTFWKRSAPPAAMDIFNAPSRENCTVRRERTNTPLQALNTMNDVQFVEAARRLAERTIHDAATVDARLDYVTARVISRPFDPKERRIARASYQDFLAHYKANPGDAAKLIAAGDSKPDSQLPAVELAAWTMIANQVLNLDEALNK